MNLESGTIISQYKIISAIGKGGMGEVFLAQDTKLDRKVAIKFLNEEFSKDADKLNRFTQEAKAVSALNHPNILTVYEIGETDDTNYIVTEFIEGKTLRERLSHKDPLQLNAILKIGVQVSEALSAAHQAGIIHRDIKPENIMIRKDGYAKVLDFGLAKLSEPPASAGGEDATRVQVNTTPGMVMGTVSYMSPEQARGNPTDARTDLWSLGVVLYEMLAGKVPFTGETVNHTIVSILEKEPKLLDNVLDELQRIVRKSLTKDVDMRYQSARDMLIDLKNLRRELDIQGELERSTVPNRDLTGTATENATQMLTGGGESTSSGQIAATQNVTTSSSSLEYAVTQAKSHKLATAVAAVLLVAVIAAVGYFGLLSKGGSSKQIESIAVMPFVNESGNADVEYLSDGMTETLISSLSQLPNLQVKARSSVFRYKGKDTDPKTIGMELNVQAILNGRVMQRGDQLTLSAELVDVTTENVIWSKRYDRRLADAQAVQSEIAQDVSARLRSKLADEGEPGQKNQTVSPEAYQAYLKGRFYLSQDTEESLKKSVEQFSRAISLEPNYALAYAGLATVYAEISSQYLPPSEAMPKAKDAVLKALALDGSLAEAHLALAEIHWWSDWDFPAAEQEFKRAIELNPNEPKNYSLYGLFLARTLARFDEGKIMAERALQVDSLAPDVRSNIASVFYTSRQSDRVIEEANKLLELDRNSASGHRLLGGAYLLKGQYEQAIVELEKAVDREGGFGLERLGYAYAAAGRKNDALKKIAELQALAEKKYIPPMWFARIYVSLGDKERAFEWLEKAYAGRDDALTHLKTDPLLDSLRSDPRFTDLMRRVGLPQ